jgi:hypothetical protein
VVVNVRRWCIRECEGLVGIGGKRGGGYGGEFGWDFSYCQRDIMMYLRGVIELSEVV